MNVPSAHRLEARRAGERAGRIVASAVASWQEPARRRLGLALATALLAALAFARVAEDYLTNDPLARWDVSFARWLAGERTAVGLDVFRVVTFFGSAAALVAISAVVTAALLRRRRTLDAGLVVLVLAGAEALNLILKLSFHRPRPEVAFIHLDTYSFPSGHAMVSTAVYGVLAYLAWGHLRPGKDRRAVVAATTVLVSLICFSRLYLGVHYLSDVLAGAAGGMFWLAVSIGLVTIFGRRLVRP